MKISILYLVIIQCLLLVACQSPNSGVADESNKPNVVLIFADDLSYSAIGALGNDVIKTPNLDRLASQGTSFTHAYNMGGWNGAICVASRAMIMSGRTIWRAEEIAQRWRSNDQAAYDKTWARLMAGAGYNTYMTGKWHIAAHADTLFGRAQNIKPGMPRDEWGKMGFSKVYREQVLTGKKTVEEIMPIGYARPIDQNDNSWMPTDSTNGGFWAGGQHWSEVVRDDAIDFINDASAEEDPFFMYLAFNAPHDPRQAPQKYIDMYEVEDMPLPENWLTEYPYKDQIGCGVTLRDEALAPFPRSPYAIRKHIQEYYAIITHLDEQIGLIIKGLEDANELDNTYIIFTADHGLSVGKHGLIGKQNMYDHSMRVPLFVKGPTVAEGETNNNNVYLQDVMATALEVADIPKPSYVEFNSLLPQINNPKLSGNYSEIYGCYTDTQRMIKKDNYKLIVYPKARKLRLFDLEKDPAEMNDLAEEMGEQTKVNDLFASLQSLQLSMGDTLILNRESFVE